MRSKTVVSPGTDPVWVLVIASNSWGVAKSNKECNYKQFNLWDHLIMTITHDANLLKASERLACRDWKTPARACQPNGEDVIGMTES